VHFLVAGAILFAVTPSAPGPSPPAVVITAAQVAALEDDFTRRTGAAPTPGDQAALVRQAVDEEVLYREALARGLDRDDRSVRHRVVEKMRFLTARPDDDAGVLYRISYTG